MADKTNEHPLVQPLSYILGSWRGQGCGQFPTISPFNYTEELTFSHVPNKPVISYSQKTWKSGSGEPMHSETGFFRPKSDASIELVIAQSTGLLELQNGIFDSKQRLIQLQSHLIGNASKVTRITREYKLSDGELTYDIKMATNDTSLQTHLKASLKKIENKQTENL